MSWGPVMEGLVVDSETLKRQESRSSGAWVAVAALNASKKTPTAQSSSFIEPPCVGYVPRDRSWILTVGPLGRAVQSVEYREFYYESGTTSRRYAYRSLAARVKRLMPSCTVIARPE